MKHETDFYNFQSFISSRGGSLPLHPRGALCLPHTFKSLITTKRVTKRRGKERKFCLCSALKVYFGESAVVIISRNEADRIHKLCNSPHHSQQNT